MPWLDMEFRKVTRNGVEYRFDPLTQEQCRINPARAKRLKQTGSDIGLSEITSKSRETCPFCPVRVEEKAPWFSREICKEGRIKRRFGLSMSGTICLPVLGA